MLGLTAVLRDEKGQMPEADEPPIGEGGLESRRDSERSAATADDVDAAVGRVGGVLAGIA